MDPKIMCYVNASNIKRHSEYVTRLVEKGYTPSVSGVQPSMYEMRHLEGIVFDTDAVGYLAKDFREPVISCIVWYHWDVSEKDLGVLSKYWRGVLIGEPYKWGRDEQLLQEYTKPVPIQKSLE